MKKIYSLLVMLVFMLCLFCLNASAVDRTGEITVTDSNGEVVRTYEIVTNNINIDARKQIQYAIDYIRDNATEYDIHTLTLPEGVYGIHSSINFYSNMIFDMSQSVFYRMGDCAAMIRFGRSTETHYGTDGFSNIVLTNGCIDGNDTGTNSLMRFAHASNVEINNVTFRNTYDVHHQLTFAASEYVKITDCEFLDMDFSNKADGYNCEAVQIDILKEEHFSYPAMDGTGSEYIEISDCRFENLSRGVGTHSAVAGHYFNNMRIVDNTFEDITGYAVSALNYRNSEISDNDISDCGSGILCSTVPSGGLEHLYAPFNYSDKTGLKLNVNITDNEISLSDKGYGRVSFGIKLLGSDVKSFTDKNGRRVSGDFRISGVTVKNNTISSSVSKDNFYSINISYAAGSEYSDKSDLSISGNKIIFNYSGQSSNLNHGIRAEASSKIYIGKNTVYDKSSSKPNLDSGIYIKDCSSVRAVSNTVKNTSEVGIKVMTLNTGVIKGSKVTNTKGNGIYVYTQSKKVTVHSNKTEKTKGYGIAVKDSTSCKVVYNNIYSAGSYGIHISGVATCSSVDSNYICNSKNSGVVINNSASVTSVSKNKIDLTSPSLDAISVKSSASVKKINSNQINRKKNDSSKSLKVKCRNGIMINSKSCKISEIKNNSIADCAENGIYIYAAKSTPTVSDNAIKICKYGIRYCKGFLSGNTVKSYSKGKYKKI